MCLVANPVLVRKMQFLTKGHQVNNHTPRLKMTQMPITNKTLKTALPNIVPNPSLDFVTKTPRNDVKNSGALPSAAINVASARSSNIPSEFDIMYKGGSKNSSQTIANPCAAHSLYRVFFGPPPYFCTHSVHYTVNIQGPFVLFF